MRVVSYELFTTIVQIIHDESLVLIPIWQIFSTWGFPVAKNAYFAIAISLKLHHIVLNLSDVWQFWGANLRNSVRSVADPGFRVPTPNLATF